MTLKRPNQAIIKAQLSFAKQETRKVLQTDRSHPQENALSPSQHLDYFEVYSTNGVVAQELQEFGVVSRRPSFRQSNGKHDRVRKTRVSTEIHPDLLMAELFLDGDTDE